MKDSSSTKRQSRSPHISHRKRRRSPSPVPDRSLPLHASRLGKHDYAIYKPMFSLYLEIQKQLVLQDLSETEIRGRWKSFVGKWNRGELAEGWYDPVTLKKASESSAAALTSTQGGLDHGHVDQKGRRERGSSDDDEEIGPALPDAGGKHRKQSYRSGPAIPGLQGLELRRELAAEDSAAAWEALRHERLLNRKQEKERLEDLAPRAAAGSKERMLEKKKEKAATNRAFAAAKTEAGGVVDVPESELLGDDGGIDGFKKQQWDMERKKNEREIRREEVLRARAEEREERMKQYREKEEATMKGLVELAKARFG